MIEVCKSADPCFLLAKSVGPQIFLFKSETTIICSKVNVNAVVTRNFAQIVKKHLAG